MNSNTGMQQSANSVKDSLVALDSVNNAAPERMMQHYSADGGYSVRVAPEIHDERERQELPIVAFLKALRERKWTALGTLAIVTAVFTFGTFRLVPEYDATAKIIIGKNSQKLLSSNELIDIDAGDREYFQTQLDLLRSRSLVKRVIEKQNLGESAEFRSILQNGKPSRASKPLVAPIDQEKIEGMTAEQSSVLIDAVLKRLNVKTTRDSRLVNIQFTARDPQLAADAANAFAKSYIDYNLESHFRAATSASTWLQEQLADLRAKVERSQEAVVKYGKDNQIISLDDKKNVTVERFAALNEQLVQAETDRIKAEAIYRQSLDDPGNMPQIIQNPMIIQYLGRLTELKQNYARLTQTYQQDYPEVQEAASQIEQVEKQIAHTRQTILGNIASEFQSSQRREKNLKGLLNTQKALTIEQNDRAVQYGMLKREADATVQLYETLLQKTKEAGVTQALQTTNIQIVDEAETPRTPARPNHPRNIGLGLLLGLMLGIGAAFLTNHLDDSIKSAEEVDTKLKLASLGAIPVRASIKNGNRKLLASGAGGESEDKLAIYKEAYRNLRTSILLSHGGRRPQVILVTSSMPSEGKSTVTANIAMMLAHTGARVLVIDGDMRHPTCHVSFKASNVEGLSTLLSTSESDGVIQRNAQTGVDLISAGPIPPNPSELLSCSKMEQTIESLREYYDHILIDSPPVIGFPDSIILAQHADGVVIVVQAGKTPQNLVWKVKQRLQRASAKILGVVLNGVDSKNRYYEEVCAQNYYYYRGHKESASKEKDSVLFNGLKVKNVKVVDDLEGSKQEVA